MEEGLGGEEATAVFFEFLLYNQPGLFRGQRVSVKFR
jgi:hypothetical protein